MIEIIPGIGDKEWKDIEAKVTLVAPYVPWIQIDISDGTLLSDTTFLDFAKFSALTKSRHGEILSKEDTHRSELSFEAHLMVANPEKYIRSLVEAGFKRLIAHIESTEPRLFLDEARYESVEVIIASDGPSELEQIEPFLEEVDGVLLMTSEMGLSDRKFQPEVVEKIRAIRSYFPDLPIEVEGGLSPENAKLVVEAGATRLVSSSFIFKDLEKIAQAIESLKNA